MRFSGFALALSALVFGACAGGDNAATTDTAATAAPATDAAAPAPAGDVAAAPITGTTHTVRAVMENGAYRFIPDTITIAAGDGIKYVMESGMPHNVAFLNVPANVSGQLNANIPAAERLGDLATRIYTNVGEEVTISFANIPAGTYDYTCTPHQAMGMNGKVTVR